MGGCLLYPHSLLQLPSFSAFTPPRFRKPLFPIQEISLALSIRADDDGKKGRNRKNLYSGRAPDGDEAKSSLSPNKEEILALFKRIQSSISKGDTTVNQSKRRSSKNADDNKPSSSPSAESILEVLHQSRTQRKGKAAAKKGDKFVPAQKGVVKEEASGEYASTRLPSSFTRRSPIPTLSSPREEVEPGNEAMPGLARDGADLENEISTSTTDDEEASKLEEMKLPQLKEVAKSKGIKGYSKLRKSELIELLLKS